MLKGCSPCIYSSQHFRDHKKMLYKCPDNHNHPDDLHLDPNLGDGRMVCTVIEEELDDLYVILLRCHVEWRKAILYQQKLNHYNNHDHNNHDLLNNNHDLLNNNHDLLNNNHDLLNNNHDLLNNNHDLLNQLIT